jgi:hypothetical protein
MAFTVIKKDFLPIALHDGCNYREYSVRYSYTGREFSSIWGYLISNGVDEYWATEEDILEMMPQVDLSEIDDATKSKPRQKVLDIFERLVNIGEDVNVAVKRIQNFTKDPIVLDYIIKYRDNYY